MYKPASCIVARLSQAGLSKSEHDSGVGFRRPTDKITEAERAIHNNNNIIITNGMWARGICFVLR